jgi:hypothetical protein
MPVVYQVLPGVSMVIIGDIRNTPRHERREHIIKLKDAGGSPLFPFCSTAVPPLFHLCSTFVPVLGLFPVCSKVGEQTRNKVVLYVFQGCCTLELFQGEGEGAC